MTRKLLQASVFVKTKCFRWDNRSVMFLNFRIPQATFYEVREVKIEKLKMLIFMFIDG
jgi:hypothetical protein